MKYLTSISVPLHLRVMAPTTPSQQTLSYSASICLAPTSSLEGGRKLIEIESFHTFVTITALIQTFPTSFLKAFVLLLDLIALILSIKIKLGILWKHPTNWARPAAGRLPKSVVRTLSRSQLLCELEHLTFCPHFKVPVMSTKHSHSPKY